MKKFISLLLATSMAFAVPTFADTEGQSYAEVYAEKAKELFGITDPNYTYNFEKNVKAYLFFPKGGTCKRSISMKMWKDGFEPKLEN
mgnify:CR=1 FL=1